jgi:hypothetical protein
MHMNAGGEDFGYFATGDAGSTPAVIIRAVESASRRPVRRGLRVFREQASCVSKFLARKAPRFDRGPILNAATREATSCAERRFILYK